MNSLRGLRHIDDSSSASSNAAPSFDAQPQAPASASASVSNAGACGWALYELMKQLISCGSGVVQLSLRLGGVICTLALAGLPEIDAGELVVKLSHAADVTFVGAVDRWDADGNPRRAVDPKAKIEAPDVDAIAKKSGEGTWTFAGLAPGRYDLVILARDRKRIEGFGYPPVLEFDPFIAHTDQASDAACDFITNDIAKMRLYENKVVPLYFAGDDKTVRVFVQLLRDKPTSFDAEFGEPVATLRHETWQYTNRFGAWSKEKRTRVFGRVLTGKRELRRWTWVWEPALSQIEVAANPVTVSYALPQQFVAAEHRGLLPY